jgi:hypothetical protein
MELVDRLIAAGLLRANRRDAMIAKIAAGDMSGEDWQLEIELARVKAVIE